MTEAEVNMVKWYYEKKELRNTPSVLNGLALDTEQRYRREGARFIIDLGSSMNLSLTTMATGVVYYHRFYMFHTFQDFPRYPTACACLFLAGKVEETPKKCKDVVKYAKDLLPENKFLQFGPESRNMTEEVMTLERILLQTIKFDLQVEHPYTFLLKYAKCLKGDKNRLQKMVQMAWTFVNDSLCTTLCLQWEPEIIAIALMYLAGKLSKFEVVDWDRRRPEHLRWWDMFVEDMSIEILEDICHQVLDLYSQTQQPPPPDSPPPQQEINFPAVAAHPTNLSPLNNPATPQAGSKTSTPTAVQTLTPTIPVTGASTAGTSSNTSFHTPTAPGYSYPPQMVAGMPPYAQLPPLPPQVSPLPFAKANQPPPPSAPPAVPSGGYGGAYYPPPPPTRPYQPPK